MNLDTVQNELPQLYYFSKSLEKGLPQQSADFIAANGVASDEEYVYQNFKGKNVAIGAGVVAAGTASVLLAKDLINKRKAKKQAQKKVDEVQQQPQTNLTPTELQTQLTVVTQQDDNKNKKILLYSGIGLGVLVFVGLIIAIKKRK